MADEQKGAGMAGGRQSGADMAGDREVYSAAGRLSARYSSREFEEAYDYDGGDLGAEWSREGTVFRVWAPEAERVRVNLYDDGAAGQGGCIGQLPMQPHRNGAWIARKEGNLNGIYYTYTVTRDGEEAEACDPYARAVGVNGDRAMVIDLSKANPDGWERDECPFAGRSATDAVICEAHVRDFTVHPESGIRRKGKFLGMAETGAANSAGDETGLSYLKSLGVTHVHLLPVFDFASVDEAAGGAQYNWGYDPKNFFALEGSYATDPYDGAARLREFKQMVLSFHRAGIGVVMDVVFNHVDDAGAFCFNRIVPGYFTRIGADGTFSNGSGCGNDTASERAMVRRLIVENVLYWARECHVDGFRFDLAGLIDTETVREAAERARAAREGLIFYGEGWAMQTAATKPGIRLATQGNAAETPGFAYFSDEIRNLLRGSNFAPRELAYVNGGRGLREDLKKSLMGCPGWAPSPAQVVNYASCHDDLTLYDKLATAAPEAGREEIISCYRLAAAVVFASEGIPFFQAGEELLRRKIGPGGAMVSNSYRAGDAVNAIDWGSLGEKDCREMMEYYKGLIAFRAAHPALRLSDAAEVGRRFSFLDLPGEGLRCVIDCAGVPGEEAGAICLIFWPEKRDATIPLPAGEWQAAVAGGRAGVEPLFSASGSVRVGAVSASFLILQK